jgi:hypothetical protein
MIDRYAPKPNSTTCNVDFPVQYLIEICLVALYRYETFVKETTPIEDV